MTRDEIMHLANSTAGQHWMDEAHIQRFAALVAAAERERIGDQCAEQIEAAIEDEREACAKVCERDDSMRWSGAAAAIRARSAK